MDTKQLPTLETFPNPSIESDYVINISTHEFTCLCPKTGQPDFATLTFNYIPDALCIELKSLKIYISTYRDIGTFHEAVSNQILGDIVATINPRFIRLTADFNIRGGLHTTITAEHRMSGWQAKEIVLLTSNPNNN